MPDSASGGKTMIRFVIIALMLGVSTTVGAQLPPSAHDVSTGSADRIITTPKTAEWEGDWVSVSSQIGSLDRQGIFQKAAAAANGPAADDIRRAFLKRFSSDVGRVRIAAGRFIFLSPDGSTVIGAATYAYDGFEEQISGGREIQWHRFVLTGGFGKYPVLICSEPYGILGQWMMVHGESVSGMKNARFDSEGEHAMMIPADISAGALGDALDTPEFVSFLQSLPIPKKSEGRAKP
ncbi:MAG: hypothetical protein CVU71_01280 [Deltaproteobacteria bacterium HGW-Deltaproteobacteria-6]|nr:MAG: hypothetical protein CVU71_01280 [Deltaproteobacteria bacterium HGW-Deltaproteobacteria-6]